MALNLKATMAQTDIDKYILAGDLAAALEVCRTTLKDARDYHDAESETVALIGLARVHQYLGKFQDARIFADGGLKAAQAQAIPELVVQALNMSAYVFFTGSFKVDEAETDYRAALQLAHSNDDTHGIATALTGIAAVFNHAQDHTQSQYIRS